MKDTAGVAVLLLLLATSIQGCVANSEDLSNAVKDRFIVVFANRSGPQVASAASGLEAAALARQAAPAVSAAAAETVRQASSQGLAISVAQQLEVINAAVVQLEDGATASASRAGAPPAGAASAADVAAAGIQPAIVRRRQVKVGSFGLWKAPGSTSMAAAAIRQAAAAQAAEAETAAALKALRRSLVGKGVAGVYPVRRWRLPRSKPATSQPSGVASLLGGGNLIQLDRAHQQLKLTGAGVHIGIMDEGMDISHRAFGACTAPGAPAATCRVAEVFRAAGDEAGNTLVHGTLVAGVAAGDASYLPKSQNPWRGAAYKARLTDLNIALSAFEGFTNENFVAGVNQAVLDGLDIINYSAALCSLNQDSPSQEAILAARAAGITLLTAAGNDGAGAGLYCLTANHREAVGVASVDSPLIVDGYLLTVTPRLQVAAGAFATTFGAQWGRAPARVRLPAGLVLVQDASEACPPADDSVTPPPVPAWLGKVVVVVLPRSADMPCSLFDMYTRLSSTAAGVLFADGDQQALRNHPFPLRAQDLTIPYWYLQAGESQPLVVALAGGRRVQLEAAQPSRVRTSTGGKTSSFTTWGPDARLRLQPKFSAFGGSIWTTSINNTYLTISGTSFAAPMAAGSMALWLQAKQGKQQRPRDSQLVADTTAAFINTAAVIMSPEAGWAEPIVRTGAGLIQVAAAAASTVTINPPQLLVPTSRSTNRMVLTLTNSGTRAVTYILGHQPALGIDYSALWYQPTTAVPVTKEALSVSFAGAGVVKQRKGRSSSYDAVVTIPARKSVQVEVVFSVPSHLLTKPTLVNGLVTLTPRSQSINRNQLAMPPLVVPYLGFSTNYAQYSPYPQPNPKYPELSSTLSRANRICVFADLLFAECTNDINSDAVLDVSLASFNFLIEDLGFISLVGFEVPLQVPGVYRLMVRDVSTGVEQLAEERVLNPNPQLMFFSLWDGAVLSSDGSERVAVDQNKPYQLRVLFTPFVPEADAALGVQPTAFAADIRPVLRVVP